MNRTWLNAHHRKIVAAAAGAVLVLATGQALAVAGGQDPKNHSRTSASVAGPNLVAVTGVGGAPCRIGFDTQTGTLIPPDDSTSDNVAAGTVTFVRPCAGPVIGTFTGEIGTAVAGDFIHLDMRATCIGTAGLSNPCTVGSQTFASPGHTFMRNGQGPEQTHTVQMVWTGLKKGQFRFEALPGGNNSANLQFRSFVVTAIPPAS